MSGARPFSPLSRICALNGSVCFLYEVHISSKPEVSLSYLKLQWKSGSKRHIIEYGMVRKDIPTSQASMTHAQMLTFALNPSCQTTLSPALKQRACDRCRGRKTRCDGLEPCKTCARVGVDCLYAIPSKPRGRRPRNIKPQRADESDIPVTPESLGSDHSIGCDDRTIWSPSTDRSVEQTSSITTNEFADTYCFPTDNNAMTSTATTWSLSTEHRGYHLPLRTFPSLTFAPYIELFFERLYPIFPVLDIQKLRGVVAGLSRSDSEWQVSFEDYALLTSLSAAVNLQLNLHNEECLNDAFQTLLHQPRRLSNTDRTNLTFISAENFMTHCLQTRRQWDYVGSPTEANIMTSFFLFEYYGNKNNSQTAWYYLREAIGFALAMRLDEPETYENPPSSNSQRLFWLLFITERAYALQHRNTVILRPSIPLPLVYDSDQPQLVYGFVNLVRVFTRVDEQFLTAWKNKPVAHLEDNKHLDIIYTSTPLVQPCGSDDLSEMATNLEIVETQFLDISVTEKWLPLLQWQLNNGRRLTSTTAAYPMTTSEKPPQYYPYFPFKVSQDLLKIIGGANRRSLESHGIGMVGSLL